MGEGGRVGSAQSLDLLLGDREPRQVFELGDGRVRSVCLRRTPLAALGRMGPRHTSGEATVAKFTRPASGFD